MYCAMCKIVYHDVGCYYICGSVILPTCRTCMAIYSPAHSQGQESRHTVPPPRGTETVLVLIKLD